MTIDETNMTIDYLKEMQESYIEGEGYERHPLPEWYALDKAIEALEQESVLDKIRAEIEEVYINLAYIENYNRGASWGLRKALEIIDKYKKEGEE